MGAWEGRGKVGGWVGGWGKEEWGAWVRESAVMRATKGVARMGEGCGGGGGGGRQAVRQASRSLFTHSTHRCLLLGLALRLMWVEALAKGRRRCWCWAAA